MAHPIVWLDIPTHDLDRAIDFYTNVLALNLDKQSPESHVSFATFADGESDPAGCLFQSDEAQPSDDGPLLYFDVSGRMEEAIDLVERFGGTVLEPKHQIGPYGFRALVLDSEGNHLALHAESG